MQTKTKNSESVSQSTNQRSTEKLKNRSTEAAQHRKTEALSSQTPNSHLLSPARYALRKGLGFWELTFDGQHEILKHEQGLALVAYLLLNPPDEPIHALDLATRISPLAAKGGCISEIVDPETGEKAYLEKHSRVQERSLALDEALTMRAVIRQQNDLEALVERQGTTEPVKEEAWNELKALYNYETNRSERARDSAQKAVRAVRMAIKRFHKRLLESRDADGLPILVLKAFVAHLEKYLLIPSARCSFAAGLRAYGGFPGCFTYQPPEGISWQTS